MIYLDYAATTPLAPEAFAAMQHWLAVGAPFANPASSHPRGVAARQAVEQARLQVAAALGASVDEIIWTSGATEANNLALKGAAGFYARRGRHIITSRIEHKSVLDTCRYLETQGVAVSYLEPDANGRIDPEQVAGAMRGDTVLVSVMWVNNELGTVNDIAAIAQLTRARGVLLHTDAAQAVGKVAIDLSKVPVDLLSVAAHKSYGPQGSGALFVRRRPRARLAPQMHGGGHQQGMRSGTLPVHQLVATGVAIELAEQRREADQQAIGALRDRFEQDLLKTEGVVLHCSSAPRAGNYSNFHVEGVDGEALRAALPQLCVSSGSACSSATAEPSYVLRGLGLTDAQAGASLRVSCGRQTVWAELEQALKWLRAAIAHLRFAASGHPGADEPEGRRLIPVSDATYSPAVQQRFGSLPGFGRDTSADLTLRSESRASSAWIELNIRLDTASQAVSQACVRALGCPTTLAVASLVAESLAGKNRHQARRIDAQWLQAQLEIPPQRLHCALMGEDLIRSFCQTSSPSLAVTQSNSM